MNLAGEGLEEFSVGIVETIPTQIAILDSLGNIIAVNAAYRRFTFERGGDGKNVNAIGMNYLHIIETEGVLDGVSAAAALSGLTDVLTGSVANFRMAYPCDAPDMPRWFLMNAIALNDSKGSVLVSHTDITDLKDAETALIEANLRLTQRDSRRNLDLDRFFSVALDMLCISNKEGYFVRINPAVTHTLGWSADELMATPFMEFVHPDDRKATLARVTRKPNDLVPSSAENRYLHKDGSWRTISWRSVRTEDLYLYSTGRDVTEQREMEAGLRAARDEAEKANSAKNEFLSRMSHELRTPMNAVLGYAQLLDFKFEDPTIKHATHAIMKGGKHLLQLINEVLDLSRIESGNLGISLEPVEIDELIKQAVSLLKQTSDDALIDLAQSGKCDGIYVQADRQRLLQVLLNVIGNAIKYNHPGGSVLIHCPECTEDYCRVEISDTGRGIDPESQVLLFQPFQRFGDLGIDGTGLGLAVSERFVRLMGGTLGLAASSAKGSTFYVELRKDHAPKNQIVHSGDCESDSVFGQSRGKVLYIEDNLSNVSLIETILQDWKGIELISATHGRTGLELASKDLPNLILLDVHLPDLMGDKVLENLKSNPNTRNIPVVMLSADVTQRQIKASIELGADEYLTKPLDISRLFEILNQFLPSKF